MNIKEATLNGTEVATENAVRNPSFRAINDVSYDSELNALACKTYDVVVDMVMDATKDATFIALKESIQ